MAETSQNAAEAPTSPEKTPDVDARVLYTALFAIFTALSLAIVGPALHGGFIADDHIYLMQNPFTASLDTRSIANLFDPSGPAKFFIANYAPVHLLLHTAERAAFGESTLGYHVVNAIAHAICCTLFVALLRGSRVSLLPACIGGLLFAVHPANVEAVAWISQLKTTASMALALGALLALRERPALSAALFAASLLTKVAAVFALPMAVVLTWARRGEPGGGARHAGWLCVWAAAFALLLVPQLEAFSHTARAEVEAFADPLVQLRTMAAIGMRYLAMAATGTGLGPFQFPEPVLSPLDPWWLAAIPCGALLAWRLVVTLRARREEAAWWTAAAAGFAPVSQLFPFMNPIADRYLYFILPGLIGAVLLAGAELRQRLIARSPAASAAFARGAAAAALVMAIWFGLEARERAALWTEERVVLLESAALYPRGAMGHYFAAIAAAERGDTPSVVASLGESVRRGTDALILVNDPALVPLRGDSVFREAMLGWVRDWIAIRHAHGWSTQWELRSIAHAHLVLGERDEAILALEAALRAGGPLHRDLLVELDVVRRGVVKPIFPREEEPAAPTEPSQPGGEDDPADA